MFMASLLVPVFFRLCCLFNMFYRYYWNFGIFWGFNFALVFFFAHLGSLEEIGNMVRLLGLVGMVIEFISIREKVRPVLCFMRWDIGFQESRTDYHSLT